MKKRNDPCPSCEPGEFCLGCLPRDRKTWASREGSMYFIQAGENGPIKIGSSINPEKRRGLLQMGNAEELKVVLAIPGGERRERAAHKRFRHLRIRGEWFLPGFQLTSYIERQRARTRAVSA